MMTKIPPPRIRTMLVASVFGLLASACGSAETASNAATSTSTITQVSTTVAPTTTEATTTTTTTTTTTAAPPDTLAPIDAPAPIPVDPPEGMELVWSDEFDGDAVNLENWTYDIGGWGWGNGEAQFYTDRVENARTVNGLLVVELREEQFEDKSFTSARLKTQGLQEFQYGRIEARIKVPAGSGTWPAFWMLGAEFEQDSPDPAKQWPTIGEIDIMEYTGKEPDLILGTVHGPGYAGAGGKSKWFRQEFDIADEWHTFAIDWSEGRIQWFFDGEQYFELTPENLGQREWVFDAPFFIILNLAHGGTLGGVIDQDLEYPIPYLVDYVRVYQEPQS
ncbi:MAG: glycoside hydrolase family 16 protein [Acidimicrobiia bacterium]|nr:glycoside hydrolase family 16 protein [Acidimicrobiia bacterium]